MVTSRFAAVIKPETIATTTTLARTMRGRVEVRVLVRDPDEEPSDPGVSPDRGDRAAKKRKLGV